MRTWSRCGGYMVLVVACAERYVASYLNQMALYGCTKREPRAGGAGLGLLGLLCRIVALGWSSTLESSKNFDAETPWPVRQPRCALSPFTTRIVQDVEPAQDVRGI